MFVDCISFSIFSMRIIAAYLLAVLGGNESPDAATITSILDSVGATADSADVDLVISKLKGKDLDQLIADGLAKMASVPSIGGGGSSSSAAPAAGGSAPAAAKEEEKPAEKSEESDNDMGRVAATSVYALFHINTLL
jgi:large subunit ribosomal protein LP2